MATFQFYLLAMVIAISDLHQVNGLFRLKVGVPSQRHRNLIPNSQSEPLFLTPYIESNKIDEARKLSEVKNLGVNLTSYSGFLTVDKQYDSNMFFWFFPALSGKADAPILLWLQGGPGGSSLFGLFVENGPLVIDSNGKPWLRKHTWNEEFAMLFIDNPVGTGFSFTKHDQGFSTNEVQVGENLYIALEQFFTVFHEYQKNPFFLTGESYAGKYIPAVAYKIHKMGDQAKSKMNLQGMAIGDGWCDPVSMFDYGDYLYQVGLLDEMQRQHFMEEQMKAVALVEKREFRQASMIMDKLLDGDSQGQSYFQNATGLSFYYNYLLDRAPKDFDYYDNYLASPMIRESIHVGNVPYGNQSDMVARSLQNDIMDSVKPWIEELLDAGYSTLFYSGQLDIIVAAPLSENFLRTLNWNGSGKYKKAQRFIYRANPSDKTVSGFVRQVDYNLYFVLIRNAGHILPYDQPAVAQDMIRRFVRKQSFTD